MKKTTLKIGKNTYSLSFRRTLCLIFCVLLISGVAAAGTACAMQKKQEDSTAVVSPDTVPSSKPSETPDVSANKIKEEEFDGTVLVKTEDGGEDYLQETLFLGDSNTARFLRFLNKEGTTFTSVENTIGVVGMGIDAISTLPCLQTSMGMLTMPQAVSALQPRRILITFGTNNLSGTGTDATDFIARYTAQLETIQKAYPYADLIVNTLPPVAEIRSYVNVSQTQIDAYNKAIAEMCKNNGWKFLNSAQELKDEKTGYAKAGYMAEDGLHLSNTGLQALFDYIRTHCSTAEDQRPTLSQKPAVYGVPDGLIKTNPLTDEENVEQKCGENAWGDTTGCYCNSGYEGDAKAGCTPIATSTPEMTPTPIPTSEATPTPSPVSTPTPEVCSDPNAENNGSGCVCKYGYQSSESGCVPIPSEPDPVIEETPVVEEPTPVPEISEEPVPEEPAPVEEPAGEGNE